MRTLTPNAEVIFVTENNGYKKGRITEVMSPGNPGVARIVFDDEGDDAAIARQSDEKEPGTFYFKDGGEESESAPVPKKPKPFAPGAAGAKAIPAAEPATAA